MSRDLYRANARTVFCMQPLLTYHIALHPLWYDKQCEAMSPVRPKPPANARFAARDIMRPRRRGPDGNGPILVPKGKTVGFVLHLLHRRKDLWGPDDDDFRPERWENKKMDWNFVPFSGAPRICLDRESPPDLKQGVVTDSLRVIIDLLNRAIRPDRGGILDCADTPGVREDRVARWSR